MVRHAACALTAVAVLWFAGINGAAESAAEEGFTSLFDGKTLNGWQGDTDGYAAQDGLLVCLPKGGNLLSAKEYSDFVIRFDFRMESGGNNGLAVRSPITKKVSFEGIEIQILDDTAEKHKNIKNYQHHGSVYGVIPAKPGHLKPIGEWNTEEVTVQGRRIKVVLNGVTIVDGDLDEASKNGTIDGKPHPGIQRTSGYVGFIGHNERVEFRNIRIRDLAKSN